MLADEPDSVEVVFYIDNDDLPSVEAAEWLRNNAVLGVVHYVVGDRIVLSKMWNRCYEESSKEILMHCGDDIVFRSQHWDTLVKEEFEKVPDKILFVYGRDGITPDEEEFGTHGFIHRNWVETVGYFVPPYFNYGLNDEWLVEVATGLNRKKFIPELYTEHMHHVVGKAPMDQTYKDAIERGMSGNRKEIWANTEQQRKDDVERLKRFISEFK